MNLSWDKRVEKRISESKNCICMGMDPVMERIPLDGVPEQKLEKFYLDIFDEMQKRNVFPAAVKPNSAYYESISVDALKILQNFIGICEELGILVILDAKRGDIGKSSLAYARAAFDVFGADCVTVSPYMGKDSLNPFLEYKQGKGVYALLRTSNPGAADFQDDRLENGTSFHQDVAQKYIEWDNGNLGAVVGATSPQELEEITRFFCEQNHEIPFLIPGVSVAGVPGQQGGEATEVLSRLKAGGSKRNIHLLNSSSGLNYAWQAKNEPERFAPACIDALDSMIQTLS